MTWHHFTSRKGKPGTTKQHAGDRWLAIVWVVDCRGRAADRRRSGLSDTGPCTPAGSGSPGHTVDEKGVCMYSVLWEGSCYRVLRAVPWRLSLLLTHWAPPSPNQLLEIEWSAIPVLSPFLLLQHNDPLQPSAGPLPAPVWGTLHLWRCLGLEGPHLSRCLFSD